MTRRMLILSALMALTQGCATVYTQSEAVMRRAEFDLTCADGRLAVKEIGPNVFGAEGCGRRASYVVFCGMLEGSCVPMLETESTGRTTLGRHLGQK